MLGGESTEGEPKLPDSHPSTTSTVLIFVSSRSPPLQQDKKAELRNKDRELQDLEEKHQVIIKIYKQRVKHLLYEHQNEITSAKTDSEVGIKLLQDEDRKKETELKTDKRGLKLNLKEMELSHEDYLKSMKQQQDRNITVLRQEFERKASELHRNYEKRMKTVREKVGVVVVVVVVIVMVSLLSIVYGLNKSALRNAR